MDFNQPTKAEKKIIDTLIDKYPEYILSEIKNHFQPAHFGRCDVCGKDSHTYFNIRSDHYFYCDEHKKMWYAGSNLFSEWKEDNEDKWKENSEFYFNNYELITGDEYYKKLFPEEKKVLVNDDLIF